MVVQEQTIFEGFSSVKLSNDLLSIWITENVGLRVLGLSLMGEENLLAVLPEAKLPVEGAEDYSLKGGHRLWYGPENPLTTYITDDRPVEIVTVENGINVIQPVDDVSSIQKSFLIILDENQAIVTINHKLLNQGNDDFELMPWAITMLKPGGVGLIPLQTGFEDKYGLLPNRKLVFWPYTEVKSPYLEINDQAIAVRASMTEGALKIGTANPENWLAYTIDGNLFVKRSEYQKQMKYSDMGASSQIYCNPDVIEIETQGPVVRLKQGQFVEHQEIWEIYSQDNWPPEISRIFQTILG